MPGHVAVELAMGEALVAENLGRLGAQLEDVGDNGVVVVGTPVVAAADEHLERLLAQLPAGRKRQEGIHEGAAIGDDPFAVELALSGGLGGGVSQVFWQAGQLVGLLEYQELTFFVGEHILAKLGVEIGQLLVDGAELLLGLGAQFGAVAHEVLVVVFDEANLLVVELRIVAL